MRKKKKSIVLADEPRAAKPIAVLLSLAAAFASCAIVYNAFFNQQANVASARQLANSDSAATADGAKSSRTIMLKYDALVEDVQRELMSTGHFNGLVDGVTGPKTRVAIESYQRDNKLNITGEVSKTLLEHIQYRRKLDQAAEFTGSVAKIEKAVVPAVQPLAQLPKPLKPEHVADAEPKTDNAIVKVQTRLAALGYDPGSRSGQLDEGTRSAILIFEMDNGLAMHGKISKALLQAIKSAETKKQP